MKKQLNETQFSIIKVPTSMIEVVKSDSSQPLEQVEAKQKLELTGELKPSDYILDAKAGKQTTEDVRVWATKQRESTASKILTGLTMAFVGSVVTSFCFVGVVATNPKADKNFVKEVIPLIVGPQLTLLMAALGTYLVSSKIQKKE